MIFRVSEEVFSMLPDTCFGTIVLRNVDNSRQYPELDTLLEGNVRLCEQLLGGGRVKEDPRIVPYREAFRALGVNPNKYMCSIEALLTRIGKGKGMPHINPLVDLGNAVSLETLLPIGAHDVDTVKDALEIRKSVPGDRFIPFGGTEEEIPDPGEIIYVSGNEVRTRRWTWRQSERGKITTDTRNVFFPIDGFRSVNLDQVKRAGERFRIYAEELFGISCNFVMVDKEHPEAEV